jgi:hypothetical protein
VDLYHTCKIQGFHGNDDFDYVLLGYVAVWTGKTSALKMETARFSETLASTNQSIRRLNPEEHHQLYDSYSTGITN